MNNEEQQILPAGENPPEIDPEQALTMALLQRILQDNTSPTAGYGVEDFVVGHRKLGWGNEQELHLMRANRFVLAREAIFNADPANFNLNLAIQMLMANNNGSLLKLLQRTANPNFNHADELPLSLLPLKRDPVHNSIREESINHRYCNVYRGICGYEKHVVIKEMINSESNRQLLAHEIEMTQKFSDITVPLFGAELSKSGFMLRVGFKYFDKTLKDIMDEQDVEVNWKTALDLFRVMEKIERKGFLLRDFRLSNFKVKDITDKRNSRLLPKTTSGKFPKQGQIFISSPHEMSQETGSPLNDFKCVSPQSDFPLKSDVSYDKKMERHIIGQILTRFALNMKSSDALPEADEVVSLQKAKIRSCRGNLIRNIALKLLDKDDRTQPREKKNRKRSAKKAKPIIKAYQRQVTFLECTHDISLFEDEKLYNFLIRFHDFNISTIERRDEIRKDCKLFEKELYNGAWLTPQNLPLGAYKMIINNVREFELVTIRGLKHSMIINGVKHYFTQEGAAKPGHEILTDAEIVALTTNEGPYSIYRALRSDAAHFPGFCETIGANMALSRDYVNFWRTQFKLLVTAAWLLAIRRGLYRIPSFAEFFTCPNDTFYELFNNQTAHGTPFN